MYDAKLGASVLSSVVSGWNRARGGAACWGASRDSMMSHEMSCETESESRAFFHAI